MGLKHEHTKLVDWTAPKTHIHFILHIITFNGQLLLMKRKVKMTPALCLRKAFILRVSTFGHPKRLRFHFSTVLQTLCVVNKSQLALAMQLPSKVYLPAPLPWGSVLPGRR